MARQIVKGLTMLMLIVGLALASALVANGQSGKRLIAEMPFDFIVAEKTLRAGEYDVRAVNDLRDVLAIASRDGKESVLRASYETGAAKTDQEMKARLVFHRYGNTYFLRQVWMTGENTGRELPQTRGERAIERELKTIAKAHGETRPLYEVVEIVAAR